MLADKMKKEFIIFMIIVLFLSLFYYNSTNMTNIITNDSNNTKFVHPMLSLTSNDPANPTSFTNRIDFTINSSVPSLYFSTTAPISAVGINGTYFYYYFASYINASNSLVVDCFIYNTNSFTGTPITYSQNINSTSGGIITFIPENVSIGIQQTAYFKINWISGLGNVSFWSGSNVLPEPIAEQSVYSGFDSFAFYNQIAVIPIFYTTKEPLTLNSFFAFQTGGGPSNYNYSVYILAGTSNTSSVINYATNITGDLSLNIPNLTNTNVNQIVAVFIPHKIDPNLYFGVDAVKTPPPPTPATPTIVSGNTTSVLIEYKHSTMLSWTVNSTSPDKYSISLDQVVINSGTWQSLVPIQYNTENLTIGLHHLLVLFNNTIGDTLSIDIYLWVIDSTAPNFTSVPNNNISLNVGFSKAQLSWTFTDYSNYTYKLYINNVLNETGLIYGGSSTTINITLSGLVIGTYNYTMVVYDKYNNTNSNTALITVSQPTSSTINSSSSISASVTTTNPSTIPTTDSNTSHPLPDFTILLFLITISIISLKKRRQ